MAIRIPASSYIDLPNASYLNNHSSISVAMWVRFATITTANKQYIFSHRSTNQFSLRKDSTTDKFRASITSQGAFKTCDSTFVVVANTLYHVGYTWIPGDASGTKLYVNGSQDNTAATTGQTGPYDSGSSTTSLLFGSRTTTSDYGEPDIEGFVCYMGTVLAADDFRRLYEYGWPWLVRPDLRPHVAFQFSGDNLTKVPDLSGNGRHIVSSGIPGGATDQGALGKYEAESLGISGGGIATVAGAPAPNPWIDYSPTVAHPGTSQVLDGLTGGTTYEIKLTATDNEALESADSSIVEAAAGTTGVIHTVRRVFIG